MESCSGKKYWDCRRKEVCVKSGKRMSRRIHRKKVDHPASVIIISPFPLSNHSLQEHDIECTSPDEATFHLGTPKTRARISAIHLPLDFALLGNRKSLSFHSYVAEMSDKRGQLERSIKNDRDSANMMNARSKLNFPTKLRNSWDDEN